MEEFKTITPNTSVVRISACLEKIYKKICESREKNLPEHSIKEIEFLKTQCRTDSPQLSLMSCQTFVRLVENGVLESTNVLTILITMLSHASPTQYTTITEGIVSLLLLNLKRKVATLQDNEVYYSQFGIKTQQHPMITLLQNPIVNMNDVANKISGICNHHDKQIKEHCIEYLRPVFFYILCNPQTMPDSKTIWTVLLGLSKTDADAKSLMQELIAWSKLSNAPSCLFTSILLIEAIEHFLAQQDHAECIELCLYQALIVSQLARNCIDPRPSLHCILRILHTVREYTQNHYNVLLILLSESLHLITPSYLPDLLRIIGFIIVQEGCGHEYILNMCLDPVIQWMSQIAFIPAEGLPIAHQIVRKIIAQTGDKSAPSRIKTNDLKVTQIRTLHPSIGIAFSIAKLVESYTSVDTSETKDVFSFVDALNVKSNSAFCQHLHYFLRGLFLSRDLSVDCWFKIYEVLLQIVKISDSEAYDFLITYIFKLAGEQNAEIQMELLRGLPNFATSKDNIPMILYTIRNLTKHNSAFCMDLYLRLWRVEPRTYPFLVKLLSQESQGESKKWELEVAKTYTIREICQENPTHGSDFVSHLSNTLNSCIEDNEDLPTALALDSILALCDSHTVNVTSTWRVLSSKFVNEKRPRSLKALFRFFSHVPHLQTPTLEFEQLVDAAQTQLWQTISNTDSDPVMIQEALAALKHYEIGTMMQLRHIPLIYQNDIPSLRSFENSGREVIDLQMVPGECWVRLLQHIRPDCGAAAADLISNFISNEIYEFRSGVYRLPENKPEPRKLSGLKSQSVLRAVTNYLVTQSRVGDYVPEPHVVTFALRSISKHFPKPIPPLDWCFLHSFFHLSFEARKYCIMISKNQLLHSGTALRLLENFLIGFEPNCFEEDLLLLFSLLPEISNGISLQVLKAFAEKIAIYCFKESQISGFPEGCLFEKFLSSVKHIFTGKCDIPEVLDVFTLIVERYMDSMDIDSKLFERYTEVVSVLHPNSIEGLTSPSNWWEVPIGKLKKATIMRCYFVLYNTKLSNPLKWLTPIIDAYAIRPEEQHFFFRHLTATLYAFNNDEQSCNWIMDIFLEIQALLAESSNNVKLEKAIYLLEIFILSIDVLSGCAVLLGNLDIAATDGKARLEIFPECMQLICDHIFWKDQESKIYEFLYNLYKNSVVPSNFTKTFKDTIICSRNKHYFDNKSVWTKYVGLRK